MNWLVSFIFKFILLIFIFELNKKILKGLGPDTKSLNAGAQNKTGKQAVAAGGGAAGPANQEDADLEARLEALRRQ